MKLIRRITCENWNISLNTGENFIISNVNHGAQACVLAATKALEKS